MATWQEINRVRRDARGARALAQRLLKVYPDALSSWELDFLGSLSITDVREFTTRQAEKLLQIRDDSEPVTKYRGYSIASLIRQCYEARLDLNEADEEWVTEMRERSDSSIRRKHIGRLVRCARELCILEDETL